MERVQEAERSLGLSSAAPNEACVTVIRARGVLFTKFVFLQ